MNSIRILLLCSTRFALPALKELAFFKLLIAVGIPRDCDEMIERTEAILADAGIPIIKLERGSFVVTLQEFIRENGINTGLMMTFPYRIPSALYASPSNGFFNVHPGPLPKYRGADPVFQQIKNREPLAGVAIHKLDDGMDSGPVVITEMIRIRGGETHGSLTSRLSMLAARLTGTLIKLISMRLQIPARIQDDEGATYFPRQVAVDVSIDWLKMEADTIIALINACNPWNKGAIAKYNSQIIRLLQAEKISDKGSGDIVPGTILSMGETGMTIATASGALMVNTVYTEDGYFSGGRIVLLGLMTGNRFDCD